MGWLTDHLDTIGLPALLLLVIGWLLNRRKNRAEAKKLGSEAGKLDAESAQIIANAAAALVDPLTARVGQLEQRLEVLEAEDKRKTKLLDSAIPFIRTLLAWIDKHMPDGDVPEVPPELKDEVNRGEAAQAGTDR